MAEEHKSKKDKPKDKSDAKASAKPPKKEKAVKAEKAEKAEKVEKVEAPAPPRAPADPRLKYIKKFHGRFLPKGTLRDRHKAIIARWDSGEDHGGVTVDELKSLFTDWRATRAGKKASSTA